MVRFRTKIKDRQARRSCNLARRSDVSSQARRGVAEEEGAISMRVRTAFDAILDGAMLGLATVAAGILVLWLMFPS